MVILDEGLNKFRDLVNTNLTKGQAGTGTSTATPEDTGLDEAIGATLKTLSNNVSNKLLTTSFSISTTEANGLALTEFENQFSTGESIIRIRHTPINKDNVTELSYVITFEFEGE